ncbi:3-isopropylmalate/(R)-2-methylmalate dehydratase small subunit [Palleronia aestuarii]|uniref:3-isopropylmalate dehydratase n=1 Tax=Palleronia aestuarii TaxID=568105 RepID=A0A2W7Q003_9RHOB|nr:3-isopropylmalate dehydratase small subunit [Palleronia aestuarii]PZX15109.1 3-isopropylmalate/(R)-2-methylmalate dehydratase small subunit [Palleronia aestuarii]
MAGWTTHDGLAAALPQANVDTDQIIPARFMSASRKEGYGDYLFADLREGNDAFPLDRHAGISVLVAGPNFGCGSSREAAVYALIDAGIHVVVAESFAEIFAGNAVNNGLLPARTAEAGAILEALGTETAKVRVDLETRRFLVDDREYGFELSEIWRRKLVNGWDDIDLTLSRTEAIAAYRDARRGQAPWIWPKTAPS